MKKQYLAMISILIVCFIIGCEEKSYVLKHSFWDWDTSETEMAQWFMEREYLLDTSSWFEHVDLEENPSTYPDRGHLAAFGMGNGRVFTLLGLDIPLNSLSTTIGPYYQDVGGYFADQSIHTLVEGDRLNPKEEWMWRVRGTDIILSKTLYYESSLELYTCTFIPREEQAILRKLILVNRGSQPLNDVDLELKIVGDALPQGDFLIQERGDKNMAIWGENQLNQVGNPQLQQYIIPVGTIDAGDEVVGELYYYFYQDTESLTDIQSSITSKSFDTHLQETFEWWNEWMSEVQLPITPDVRVNDLMDSGIVIIQTQVDQSGATSNLHRYTSAFVRDTFAITLFYLTIGKFDEAKGFLDYLLKSYTVRHAITNSTSLTLDISSYAPPSDPESFWSTADFMPGAGKVEAPSYIPLAWYEYYKTTGDIKYLDDHFEYLKYSLLLQEKTDEGLMGWSGDEDFRYPLNIAMSEGQGLGEDPEDRYYSFNSAILYVSACEKLAEIADLLGRLADRDLLLSEAQFVRQATETHFWNKAGGFYYIGIPLPDKSTGAYPYPFEDVSPKPVWHGYHTGTEEREKANIQNSKAFLMHADGMIISPFMRDNSLLNLYDGMVPGYWLYTLASTYDPDAQKVYELYNRIASDSGEFCEMHKADYSSFHLAHDATGVSAEDITARFRPWETAINLYSLIFYLNQGEHVWN